MMNRTELGLQIEAGLRDAIAHRKCRGRQNKSRAAHGKFGTSGVEMDLPDNDSAIRDGAEVG